MAAASVRLLAAFGRSPSTISRELARNASRCRPVGDTIAVMSYDASLAGKRALALRHASVERTN
jgi:IS30 family transposase